jgi:hypothetical protein
MLIMGAGTAIMTSLERDWSVLLRLEELTETKEFYGYWRL